MSDNTIKKTEMGELLDHACAAGISDYEKARQAENPAA